MLIAIEDYAGLYIHSPDFTAERITNAGDLLHRWDLLTQAMQADGVKLHINPDTGTYVSGQGHGGFRNQDCKIGAVHSQHKEGNALDWYDPNNDMDIWCIHNEALMNKLGLWFEVSYKTPGWCHGQRVPPGSEARFFVP